MPHINTYLLWCVNGGQGLQVRLRKLYTLPLHFFIDVDYSSQIWTTPEGICPCLMYRVHVNLLYALKTHHLKCIRIAINIVDNSSTTSHIFST